MTDIYYPATALEHEIAHGIEEKTGNVDDTPDSKYSNVSEKKIILGPELKTAKANGELPESHKGRKNHNEGTRVITFGVTSNKEVSEQLSQSYRNKIDNVRKGWNSEY